MTCPTRNLSDSALEATIDAQLGQTQPVAFRRDQASLDEPCTFCSAASDYALRGNGICKVCVSDLRELAASMVRMGAKV